MIHKLTGNAKIILLSSFHLHRSLLILHVQERWQAVPNKRFVVSLAVAGVLGATLSKTLLDAVDSLPVFPQLLQLLGLWCATTFFWK
jgi:hypothetical protein